MGNKKILVVEDNPKSMRLIKFLLKHKDYHILEATEGLAALEIALAQQPDLIVMDIQLPGMSGLEVTIQLRNKKEFEKTPIIALTAYAMKGEQDKFLQAGCSDYISKPIDTRVLPLKIEYWLNVTENDND